MEKQEKRSAIFDALLEHGGMKSVLDAGSRVLGNPIFVLDMTWNVMGCSNTAEFGEDFWGGLFVTGNTENAIDQLDRTGVYAKLLASDQPVFGRADIYPNRFLGTRIRDRKDAVGMLCLCEEHPISTGDEELLVDLARALALEMVYQGEVSARRDPLASFARELIAGNAEIGDTATRARMLGVNPCESMRALSIRFPTLATGVPLYLTRSRLSGNIDYVFCAVIDDTVVLAMDAKRTSEADLESVLRCCSGEGLKLGLSGVFATLADFGRAHGQAVSAIDLYGKLGRPDVICRYDDVHLYHFLQTAARTQDLSGFYDPAVMRMRMHDAEHGTDYAQVVETYLNAGRSASICAERLFSHRNTVHYRLKRAQEMFHFDLTDGDRCFSIELTFRILKVTG